MRAKTELLLFHLLWAAEGVLRPTFRNLDQSFEGWAYRSGFLPQIRRLEAQGLVEAKQGGLGKKTFVRLTEAGRVAALGGRDMDKAWPADWDGKWRLFLFDIPVKEEALRKRVQRALADCGCGCLQGSVWIAPGFPLGAERFFGEDGKDCSHLILLEADSRGSKVDAQMVKAAWDFSKINQRYARHLEILDALPLSGKDLPRRLLEWSAKENHHWLDAVRHDPLLPIALLPAGYLGKKAWEKRRTVVTQAGRLARQSERES